MKRYHSKMTIHFASRSYGFVIPLFEIDLTKVNDVQELKAVVEAKKQEYVRQYDSHIVVTVQKLSDYNQEFETGVDWIDRGYNLYLLANTKPCEPTNVKVGDYITFKNSHNIGIHSTKVIGFSKEGIHVQGAWWVAHPYESCHINYLMTAIDTHLLDHSISISEAASFFLSELAPNYDVPFLLDALNKITYVDDLVYQFNELSFSSTASKQYRLDIYYLSLKSTDLFDCTALVKSITDSQSLHREEKLSLVTQILLSANLLPEAKKEDV